MILDSVECPADLRRLTPAELKCLAREIREFVVESVSRTGGHLGSNLGAVELTIALHRVFDSPRDILLWDTGHQAYVHKLLTGRWSQFGSLRQQGGLSGYPNRAESPHDWIENSHASTALSYAHGLASALELGFEPERPGTGAGSERNRRRVVAVVGDGALTGGMAYEALNNLGHSGRQVVIVLNDNGRSYAPTVSKLSESLTKLRLNPAYTAARARIKQALRELPAVGGVAYSTLAGLTTALREAIEPHVFFEALGVRYSGPLDGHDIGAIETALSDAANWNGPIVVHLLTHKGYGYAPAEDDEVQCLHDLKVAPVRAAGGSPAPVPYTDAFTAALLDQAERDPRVVALTAAMPGPTGLLPFKARFPDRFFDVGIAEQHLVTSAAGMAMGGLRPVVAVYSTFFSRAFDQANLDVGLHRLPVVFVLDRAGITGDDGPSHHGLLDLVLALSIPGMTVFAPSSAEEVEPMLAAALESGSPCSIRFPKTPSPSVQRSAVEPMSGRRLRRGDGSVCLLAVGKMVAAAEDAVERLAHRGIDASLWDVRVVRPADPRMIADALGHRLVVTVEDGIRTGGAGTWLAAVMADNAPDRGEMPAVAHLGIPLEYIAQGRPDDILRQLGLDGEGIAGSVADQIDMLSPAIGLSVEAD